MTEIQLLELDALGALHVGEFHTPPELCEAIYGRITIILIAKTVKGLNVLRHKGWVESTYDETKLRGSKHAWALKADVELEARAYYAFATLDGYVPMNSLGERAQEPIVPAPVAPTA